MDIQINIYLSTMKFGVKQLSKPTPKRIENLFDLMAAILGVVAGFMDAVDFIPTNVSNVTTPVITMLLVPICLHLKRYFGVTVPDQVPADKVEVVDDKKDS